MMKMKMCGLLLLLVLLAPLQDAKAIALLDGLGGATGFGGLAMSPNDDGSSNAITLPFMVNFFGTTYETMFINNNGNVTFNGPVSSFTPTAFPVAAQPMIAPFWGDVDTRNTDPSVDNNVYVASPNAETVVVTWNEVGFYSQDTSKTNSFQLVMKDQGLGNFDVDFRYENLEWTTGDASGGSDGLGGTPAQAGYDAGNGVDFFTLPGSLTAEVLDLQHTSNVSIDTPGLWSFAIRDGALPGETPDNPLMPVETDAGWNFDFNVDLNETVFIDPVVAVGYEYIVDSGPFFSSVLLPSIGDGSFELWLFDAAQNAYSLFGTLLAGAVETFTNPVDRFLIMGIEESAGVDPTDPTAFVTGLTFDGTGSVSMRMLPQTVNTDPAVVPEPGTFLLLGVGLGGLAFIRRRAKK